MFMRYAYGYPKARHTRVDRAATQNVLLRTRRLAAEAKKRVLDHLLCHAAGRDGETDEWKLAPHDVQEFTAVIKRHGLDGSPGLRSFVEAAKQLTLVGV